MPEKIRLSDAAMEWISLDTSGLCCSSFDLSKPAVRTFSRMIGYSAKKVRPNAAIQQEYNSKGNH
jgi:hypothetical protein